jgi:hypothetical protein
MIVVGVDTMGVDTMGVDTMGVDTMGVDTNDIVFDTVSLKDSSELAIDAYIIYSPIGVVKLYIG